MSVCVLFSIVFFVCFIFCTHFVLKFQCTSVNRIRDNYGNSDIRPLSNCTRFKTSYRLKCRQKWNIATFQWILQITNKLKLIFFTNSLVLKSYFVGIFVKWKNKRSAFLFSYNIVALNCVGTVLLSMFPHSSSVCVVDSLIVTDRFS